MHSSSFQNIHSDFDYSCLAHICIQYAWQYGRTVFTYLEAAAEHGTSDGRLVLAARQGDHIRCSPYPQKHCVHDLTLPCLVRPLRSSSKDPRRSPCSPRTQVLKAVALAPRYLKGMVGASCLGSRGTCLGYPDAVERRSGFRKGLGEIMASGLCLVG
ncbi:hypothetical protein BC835DRAFT_256506 [Cytidiella melzeri]|nr:hypothetical protein BC835DRAFT_256506 [Cytidiella melzeri]